MTDPNAPFDNTKPQESPTPAPGPAGGAPTGLVSAESPDAKTMGMLAHLLVIFTGFIGPLIIWLTKKDKSPFVNQQGKEALNWALTILTAFVACVVLVFIPFVNLVLCLVWPAVAVCNIVFGILSTIKVNSGQPYRYPICIRYIK
jgi:uncharacterized Tic20 family protein